ncbi:hypothetical protein K8F61_17320 [Microbacterium resistens]|uniref:Uncharacterized protein n=1 Tax=Microbacterium resistens TaxID=156977 RepID=A0ABY3RSU7_9MICO|nr:hypothetical protein [Microbacterium resistens]UGS26365.1 hypothetical protein K8F61_17320 [Microbacterium resistens]
MSVYKIPLPWGAPPLTANHRLHFREEAKRTAAIRRAAREGAVAQRIPAMTRPTVTLVWLVETRHRRDADNLVPTLKALADGLVDARVTADDTPEAMHKPMPIIAYAKGHPAAPGMTLLLWESDGPTAEEERALAALEVNLA